MSAEEAQEKKSGTFKVAIAVALLAFCGGAGAGAYAYKEFAGLVETTVAPKDHSDEESEVQEYIASELELEVGRIVVSLKASSPDQRSRRLLVEPVVTYSADEEEVKSASKSDKEVVNEITSKKSTVRDAMVLYLSQLRAEDVEGSYAMTKIQADLLKRARSATGSDRPVSVLFKDFLVQ